MKETLNSRVAVLESQVDTISTKLDEVRADIKEVHACLHKTRELILSQIDSLRHEGEQAHKEQNTRISSLENWRWYVVGIATAAGVAAKYLFNL
jgi:chaperonin cofactor prefoldin